jgi:hypothetical protein
MTLSVHVFQLMTLDSLARYIGKHRNFYHFSSVPCISLLKLPSACCAITLSEGVIIVIITKNALLRVLPGLYEKKQTAVSVQTQSERYHIKD